jgi:hypothetical protein
MHGAEADIAVGKRVQVTVRALHQAGGNRNYFWKDRPGVMRRRAARADPTAQEREIACHAARAGLQSRHGRESGLAGESRTRQRT